ncbi:MAG: NAD(P)H-binding protein [Planctomycetes bacterium]|nr:NAD(P)H-binding protein [Planctomycetota bacterium]
MTEQLHVVTGAFGYSGKYLSRMLLKAGHKVRTLTNSPDREHDFGDSIEVHKFNFDDIDKLTESMRGAEVFYNTYWVRFNHSDFKHSIAVENTLKLFEAAKNVGVKRIVHTSILNPDENSPLEYYSGKGRLERALKESGLSYAILRPTVLFGPEDILLNNIAWTIRKFPFVPMFGNVNY